MPFSDSRVATSLNADSVLGASGDDSTQSFFTEAAKLCGMAKSDSKLGQVEIVSMVN